MKIMVQPAQYVDQIKDGHEMTKLPYPLVIGEDGLIGQQDLWRGNPFRAIGFQKDLAVQQIDLRWVDALKDPQTMLGMYLITSSADGTWGVHETAIVRAEVLD